MLPPGAWICIAMVVGMMVAIAIGAFRDERRFHHRPARRDAYMDGWRAGRAGEAPVVIEDHQRFADEGYRDGASGVFPQTVWSNFP